MTATEWWIVWGSMVAALILPFLLHYCGGSPVMTRLIDNGSVSRGNHSRR